jgi:hypothetical protein
MTFLLVLSFSSLLFPFITTTIIITHLHDISSRFLLLLPTLSFYHHHHHHAPIYTTFVLVLSFSSLLFPFITTTIIVTHLHDISSRFLLFLVILSYNFLLFSALAFIYAYHSPVVAIPPSWIFSLSIKVMFIYYTKWHTTPKFCNCYTPQCS